MSAAMVEMETLKRILDSMYCGTVNVLDLPVHNNDDESLGVLKVLLSKKLTFLALKMYTPNSELPVNIPENIDDEISKLVVISKAWDSALLSHNIESFLSDITADSTKKSLLFKKLDNLFKLQNEILSLTNEEKSICLEEREECVALQKALFQCKKVIEKNKSRRSVNTIPSPQEKKLAERIEKINMMRKLIIAFLLSFNFTLEEKWVKLFTSIRETVTLDTFFQPNKRDSPNKN